MGPLSAAVIALLALAPPPATEDQPPPSVLEPEPEPEPEPVAADAAVGTGAATAAAGEFSVHRKVRISLDGNLLGFRHDKEWFEDSVDPDAVEAEQNTVGVGVGRHNFGVGVGYGITDGLIIGARVGLGFTHTQTINDEPTDGPDDFHNELSWVFRPYVEYAFIPGGRFRPFVFIQGGPSGFRTMDRTTLDKNDRITNHFLGGTIGGGGGLHMFIVRQVSFDVMAEVNHYWFALRNEVLVDGDPLPGADDAHYVRSLQTTELNLLLGLSIWLP